LIHDIFDAAISNEEREDHMIKRTFIITLSALLISFNAFAGILLPLPQVRDQGDTTHCWAYAMTHAIEARTLARDSNEVVIHIEKDLIYWAAYERLMEVFNSKQDYPWDPFLEMGRMFEFWKAFQRHGKQIVKVAQGSNVAIYSYPNDFKGTLGFIAGQTQDNSTNTTVLIKKLKATTDVNVAKALIEEALNQHFGKPDTSDTPWLNGRIGFVDVPKYVMGSDLPAATIQDWIVVEPSYSSNVGQWEKMGGTWVYHYPRAKLMDLIRASLDQKWPVTHANWGHARTIIGYQDRSFAVADSIGQKITWFTEDALLRDTASIELLRSVVGNLIPPPPTGAFEKNFISAASLKNLMPLK
jgi:hypothetical protein